MSQIGTQVANSKPGNHAWRSLSLAANRMGARDHARNTRPRLLWVGVLTSRLEVSWVFGASRLQLRLKHKTFESHPVPQTTQPQATTVKSKALNPNTVVPVCPQSCKPCPPKEGHPGMRKGATELRASHPTRCLDWLWCC